MRKNPRRSLAAVVKPIPPKIVRRQDLVQRRDCDGSHATNGAFYETHRERLAVRITKGDEVRAYYGPPGDATSFVEGVVSRVDVTTTRGRGFLINIIRDVLLGREQPVKPGYQHFVLYERWEQFPDKVEVLSQAQRKPVSRSEHGSEPDIAEGVEQRPETEAVPEPEPLTQAEADAKEAAPQLEAEADGSPVEVERQDRQRKGGRIISMFGRKK
jgi:hypothetical protein